MPTVSEEVGFLKAIRASGGYVCTERGKPRARDFGEITDILPWLVYADWLDERGRGDEAAYYRSQRLPHTFSVWERKWEYQPTNGVCWVTVEFTHSQPTPNGPKRVTSGLSPILYSDSDETYDKLYQRAEQLCGLFNRGEGLGEVALIQSKISAVSTRLQARIRQAGRFHARRRTRDDRRERVVHFYDLLRDTREQMRRWGLARLAVLANLRAIKEPL